jgi:hypothetical protein
MKAEVPLQVGILGMPVTTSGRKRTGPIALTEIAANAPTANARPCHARSEFRRFSLSVFGPNTQTGTRSIRCEIPRFIRWEK